MNDFLCEKIQEVNEFKKIIPLSNSQVLSAIEEKEMFLVLDNDDNVLNYVREEIETE